MHWFIYQRILRKHIQLLSQFLNTMQKPVTIISREDRFKIVHTSYVFYNKIIRQAANLNKAFGWQILLTVPLIVLMLLYNIYYLSKLNADLLMGAFHILLEVILGVVSLVLFVVPSSQTIHEVNQFSDILQNINRSIEEDILLEEMVLI